jgi:hypothetical protein
MKPRLPERLLDELAGLNWSLTNGGKHFHLRVNGRLVGVYPRGRIIDRARTSRMVGAVRRYKKMGVL